MNLSPYKAIKTQAHTYTPLGTYTNIKLKIQKDLIIKKKENNKENTKGYMILKLKRSKGFFFPFMKMDFPPHIVKPDYSFPLLYSSSLLPNSLPCRFSPFLTPIRKQTGF